MLAENCSKKLRGILKNLILAINIILFFKLSAIIINIPGDFPTISEGIANSQSHDTLLVAEGEYYENFSIPHPLSIIGNGSDQTIITGIYFTNPTTSVQADSVNLIDLNISGIDSYDWMMEPAAIGIEIQNSSSFLLTSCEVFGGDGISGEWASDGADAFHITNSSNIILSNSFINGGEGDYGYSSGGNGGDGLVINLSVEFTIINCIINAGSGGDGLNPIGSLGGYGGDGVKMNHSSNILLSSCSITGGFGEFGDFPGSGGNGIKLFNTNDVQADSISTSGGGSYASGGDGLRAINNSYITVNNSILEGGNGNPSGSPYYSDSTSTIIINTNINNNIIPFNQELTLNQNFPNPFNPTTTILFSIPEESKVDLLVYNIKGQKVRVFTFPNQSSHKATTWQAGLGTSEYSVVWNGKDSNNKSVASGIYFYQLKVNGKTEAVKKCLLLK
jgi:hypothetical protein